MSKLGCPCGHEISDTTDNLPYKGMVIADQDAEEFFDILAESVNTFAAAVAAGRREEWIQTRLGGTYPAGMRDSDVLHDAVIGFFLGRILDIYECEQCGRVLLQRSPADPRFFTYTPDANRRHEVLKSGQRRQKPGSEPR
jgi:hypothetical protein